MWLLHACTCNQHQLKIIFVCACWKTQRAKCKMQNAFKPWFCLLNKCMMAGYMELFFSYYFWLLGYKLSTCCIICMPTKKKVFLTYFGSIYFYYWICCSVEIQMNSPATYQLKKSNFFLLLLVCCCLCLILYMFNNIYCLLFAFVLNFEFQFCFQCF